MEDENEMISDMIILESKLQNSISNNTTSNTDISENNINNEKNTDNLINIKNNEYKFNQLKNLTEEIIKSTTKRRRNSALIRQLVSKDKK